MAWEEVGPSNCPDKAPLTGERAWSGLEVPRASESNDFTYHEYLVKCDQHNPAVLL